MSLSKHIAQNVLWRGSYFLIQFLVTLFLARVLGPEEGGTFFLLLNNLSLAVLVIGFSLESALVYMGASNEIGFSSLFKMGLLWILLSAVALILLGILLPPKLWAPTEWQWAALFVLFTLVCNFMSALFQVRDNYVTYNRVMSLVYLTFLLFAWLYYRYASVPTATKNQTIILLYIGAVLLQGILLLLIGGLRWTFSGGRLFNTNHWAILLKYASKAFAANVLFFLVYRVDYWFIDHYCSQDQVGIYIQVSKLAQAFIILPAFFSTVVFPHTAGGRFLHSVAPLLKISRYLLFIYSLGFIGLILLGPWIFPLVYGNAYAGMEAVFSAMVPGILALSLQTILAAWFAGKNEVGVNIKGAALALLVIILLNIWWVPQWGIMGAAFASSAGYIVYFLYEYILFYKRNHFDHQDYFMVRKEDHMELTHKIKSTFQ